MRGCCGFWLKGSKLSALGYGCWYISMVRVRIRVRVRVRVSEHSIDPTYKTRLRTLLTRIVLLALETTNNDSTLSLPPFFPPSPLFPQLIIIPNLKLRRVAPNLIDYFSPEGLYIAPHDSGSGEAFFAPSTTAASSQPLPGMPAQSKEACKWCKRDFGEDRKPRRSRGHTLNTWMKLVSLIINPIRMISDCRFEYRFDCRS